MKHIKTVSNMTTPYLGLDAGWPMSAVLYYDITSVLLTTTVVWPHIGVHHEGGGEEEGQGGGRHGEELVDAEHAGVGLPGGQGQVGRRGVHACQHRHLRRSQWWQWWQKCHWPGLWGGRPASRVWRGRGSWCGWPRPSPGSAGAGSRWRGTCTSTGSSYKPSPECGHLSWLMRRRWRMETVHMVMSRLVCTSHSARPSGHRPSSSMAALGSITSENT